MTPKTEKAIFIHSLFRSGSTYIFNAFRRTGAYWCYQEPFNEQLIYLDTDPERLINESENDAILLRHPPLKKPYFWEFYSKKDEIKGLFESSFSYEDFFSNNENTKLPIEQEKYIKKLIDISDGRPVLQFCRSFGRARALKKEFNATTIHLWREPRSQWWSYNVNSYFPAVNHLIYNARELPPVLYEIKSRCKISDYRSENVWHEIEFSQNLPSTFRNSYFSFFGLWLYSFVELKSISELEICIDKLCSDKSYTANIINQLKSNHINGIDYSDCQISTIKLNSDEEKFYIDVENEVAKIFIKHGYNSELIYQAINTSQHLNIKNSNNSISNEHKLREIIKLQTDELAETKNALLFYQKEIEKIRQSISWRITRPFRVARRLFTKT